MYKKMLNGKGKMIFTLLAGGWRSRKLREEGN